MLGNNVCKVSQKFLCMGVGWKVLHSIIHKLAKGKSTHKPQQGVPALLTSTATKEGIWYRFLCCISNVPSAHRNPGLACRKIR